MSVLISVVVPIFNVENWLSRCIESILKQSYTNIELILVNDGSPDRCGEICDDYAEKDNRIRTIHKVNGGLSSARNVGIEAATGKYIVFIDPDDEICNNYFIKLCCIAEENKCDAVISALQTVPENIVVIPNFKLNTLMNGLEFVLSASNIHSNGDLCFVPRYMYNLNLIKKKNIRFNEQVYLGEDAIFNLEFLLTSKRVYAIPDILYLYTVNNPNSIMRASYKPNLESSLILQYKIRKQFSERYGLMDHKHYKEDMANYYINHILKMIINNLKTTQSKHLNNELRRIINYEMFTDSFMEVGFSYKGKSLKEYIYYLALKFKLYPLIAKKYKKDFRLYQ